MVYGFREGRKLALEARREAALAWGDLSYLRSDIGQKMTIEDFKDKYGTDDEAILGFTVDSMTTRVNAITTKCLEAGIDEFQRYCFSDQQTVAQEFLGMIGISGREAVVLSAGIDPTSEDGKRIALSFPDQDLHIQDTFLGKLIIYSE